MTLRGLRRSSVKGRKRDPWPALYGLEAEVAND